jgi:hypothetical protein
MLQLRLCLDEKFAGGKGVLDTAPDCGLGAIVLGANPGG